MRIMTLKQIAKILNSSLPEVEGVVKGFCVDSRLTKKNEVFVALRGEHVDGHAYLNEVKQKGALAAIVDQNYQGPVFGMHLFRTENPLLALQMLAQKCLEKTSRIVAVTGSIGKTTTKEFIKTLLEQRYVTAASQGNSNSQVGLPLTVLNHTTGTEDILVLEMGMTEPGQLSTLVNIAHPEVSVLTTAALVHACRFETLKDIALTKAEIFSHSHTRLGVVDREIEAYETIAQIGECKKISFSTVSSRADYHLETVNEEVRLKTEGQSISLGKMCLPGKHNLHNLLAAIAVARYFELTWNEIKQAIPFLKLPERRLQFVQKEGIYFLNDSYNASELSVKSALETLPNATGKGYKIAVLGSMMELGHFSDECHQRVGEFALNYVDKMYCFGAECLPIVEVWKKANRPVELFMERSELISTLKKNLKPADVVLLKGSRSKELWKILEEL